MCKPNLDRKYPRSINGIQFKKKQHYFGNLFSYTHTILLFISIYIRL